jgi:hypothetical protein
VIATQNAGSHIHSKHISGDWQLSYAVDITGDWQLSFTVDEDMHSSSCR